MTDTLVHQRHPDADALLALLRERRSIFAFHPQPVPAELLREALDAGRFAPNHKLTEPWRFTVVGPETRERMTGPWVDFALSRLPSDTTPERRLQVAEAAREKWLSKPTTVIVSQALDPDPFRREEDYAAVSGAIQNIQLASWALGLGTQWSTSPATQAPTLREIAGIPEEERIVAFLFMGYPAAIPSARRRELGEIARWLP